MNRGRSFKPPITPIKLQKKWYSPYDMIIMGSMKDLSLNKTLNNKIKTVMPFKFLEPAPSDFLLERSEIQQYEEGEVIIRQGEVNQSFYSIIEGTINVTVHNDNGTDSYICSIGKGEVFGEAGMFLKVPRTANVIAGETIKVVMIPRTSVLKLIREFPENGNKFLLMIIFSLLRKLKGSNQELAFERRSDADQDDIDDLVNSLLG